MNLKLIKKKQHTIRIEMPGYRPLEIRLTSPKRIVDSIIFNAFLGVPLGMFLLGPIIFRLAPSEGEEENIPGALFWGFVLGWGGAVIVDNKVGKNYLLSPRVLDLTLTKIEGNPQPLVILTDSEQFQNIKWIRIKCATQIKIKLNFFLFFISLVKTIQFLFGFFPFGSVFLLFFVKQVLSNSPAFRKI